MKLRVIVVVKLDCLTILNVRRILPDDLVFADGVFGGITLPSSKEILSTESSSQIEIEMDLFLWATEPNDWEFVVSRLGTFYVEVLKLTFFSIPPLVVLTIFPHVDIQFGITLSLVLVEPVDFIDEALFIGRTLEMKIEIHSCSPFQSHCKVSQEPVGVFNDLFHVVWGAAFLVVRLAVFTTFCLTGSTSVIIQVESLEIWTALASSVSDHLVRSAPDSSTRFSTFRTLKALAAIYATTCPCHFLVRCAIRFSATIYSTTKIRDLKWRTLLTLT